MASVPTPHPQAFDRLVLSFLNCQGGKLNSMSWDVIPSNSRLFCFCDDFALAEIIYLFDLRLPPSPLNPESRLRSPSPTIRLLQRSFVLGVELTGHLSRW